MFDDLPYLSRILKIINPNIDISFIVPDSSTNPSQQTGKESEEFKNSEIIENKCLSRKVIIGPDRGPIGSSLYGQGIVQESLIICIFYLYTFLFIYLFISL